MNQNRGLDSSRSINISSEVLVMQLNQLLASLNISINLDSYSQLAPSLLIAILESLMSTRLNISQEHRAALSSSDMAKVHCMKIFLGVFQADILKEDVGISQVDPRRLARGEEKETLYVARLLCWYGRHTGRISRRTETRRSARDASLSPSTLTTVTRHTATDVSVVHPESNTTVSDVDGPFFDDVLHNVVVVPARCIHEVPSPSLVLSPGSHVDEFAESCLFAPSHTSSSVRYDGYISVVNEDAEIAAFEARRDAQVKGKGKRSHSTRYAPDSSRETHGLDVDEVFVDADVLAADDAQIMKLRRRKAELLDKLAQLRLHQHQKVASRGP
ncbi:hypothetical protein C8R45DRAFT_441279 [Mycena sanguinolenta]|nr:hypothetical protein C8R45DRAFT_441279 [Mycena sanguinolenta]